jgi:hypothetical protein
LGLQRTQPANYLLDWHVRRGWGGKAQALQAQAGQVLVSYHSAALSCIKVINVSPDAFPPIFGLPNLVILYLSWVTALCNSHSTNYTQDYSGASSFNFAPRTTHSKSAGVSQHQFA